MDGRRLVSREVVQHDVDLQRRLDARVDVAEERDEILRAMLRLAAREDLARRDVQRGEEIERAVAQVVVGLPLGLPDVHRQDRLRALERLDLGFLVEREHHRIVGGFMYSPTTSRTLSTSCGSGDILNDSVTCGLRPNVRQMRPTIV